MFAFSALLKRQFLLKFKEKFLFTLLSLLSMNLIFLYPVFFSFLRNKMIMHFGFSIGIVRILSSLAFSSAFSSSTTFAADIISKNKSIAITPINSYLIHFSYLFYSFVFNFVIKLVINLITCVIVFLVVGVFYHQQLWFILFESFSFAICAAIYEMFMSFFFAKHMKKIYFVLTFVFATFQIVLQLLSQEPIIVKLSSLSLTPMSFINQNNIIALCKIVGIQSVFADFVNYQYYINLIIFFVWLFFMLVIQELFVFVREEKKFQMIPDDIKKKK